MVGILDLMKKFSTQQKNLDSRKKFSTRQKYSRVEVKILVSEKKILDSRKKYLDHFCPLWLAINKPIKAVRNDVNREKLCVRSREM